MKAYADGVERPDSFESTTLTQAIVDYFAEARDREVALLKAENEAMRRKLVMTAKA